MSEGRDGNPNGTLEGRRVLIVEDEYLLASDLARAFRARGAEVAGPFATGDRALDALGGDARFDLALLDVNLRNETVFPVADRLSEMGVRFAFVTGYADEHLPARFAHVERHAKPVETEDVVGLAERILAAEPRAARRA